MSLFLGIPFAVMLTCLGPKFCRLRVEAPVYYPIARPRWKLCACKNVLQETTLRDAEVNSHGHGGRRKPRKEGAYIDKDGVARTFDRKKISRKRGNGSAFLSF